MKIAKVAIGAGDWLYDLLSEALSVLLAFEWLRDATEPEEDPEKT